MTAIPYPGMTSVLDNSPPQRPSVGQSSSALTSPEYVGRRLAGQKVVVVHGGARDGYQVALALSEAGLLQALVTDLFWPSDRPWARHLSGLLPASLQSMLRQRSQPALPSSEVRNCVLAGCKTLLLDRLPRASFDLRRRAVRSADSTLGRAAGRLAAESGSGLLSYSYFAYDAFRSYPRPGILFQVHPHPATIRRILSEELAAHPDCAASLQQEWELALPEQDFQNLVAEPALASRFLCASSFTRRSLVENGAAESAIRVIPYGVDLDRFHPDPTRRYTPGSKLRLLFVGRINQRKGVKYLLEALSLLNTDQLDITICGRVVDGLELFQPFADRIRIRPNVSAAELTAAYQAADLFVFPSVAEGFGQVLLESLASGLPVLSTTHTAAPDLIDSGSEGFIIEPRRPDLLAERIDWALTHRSELAEMGHRARARAMHFTWQRFRSGIVSAVEEFLPDLSGSNEPGIRIPDRRFQHSDPGRFTGA